MSGSNSWIEFHLVAEQVHPPGTVLVVGREDVDAVAAHPERAAREIAGGALVLRGDQVGDQLALVDAVLLLDGEGHRRIGLDRADAVDARHGGDDDDVVAFQQGARRRVPHAVDLLVDRRILLDVGVGARDVGFRLVVVVIRDEILDRVVGEEALELAVKLGRQRLVRRQHQRRALRRLDHLCHGEGLARAGHAQQNLGAVVAVGALDEILDRRRLVALGLQFGLELDLHAAFGLFRPRRTVRRPHRGAAARGELRPALAQQFFQRLHRSRDAERDGLRRGAVHLALLAARLRDVGDFVARGRRFLLGLNVFGQRPGWIAVISQRLAELGIDVERLRLRQLRPGQRSTRHVAALRRLIEALYDRFACGVLAPPVGAALERIVRRLLQPGARTHAGGAAPDARVEQLFQRRVGRRRVGAMRLGPRRPGRVFPAVFGRIAGGFGHRWNMGGLEERGKGERPRFEPAARVERPIH